MDDPLLVLWRVSLLLSVVSILVLGGLIVARFVGAVGASRRARAQKGLIKLLIEISTGEPPQDPALMRLIRNRRLTAQALVEFSTLVRGDDLANALEQLKNAGLGQRLRPLLAHSDKEVRLVAIEALGLLMDDRNEAALRRVARRGGSLQQVVTAARALQSSGRGLEPGAFLKGLEFRRTQAPAELGVVLAELAIQDPAPLCNALQDPNIHASIKVLIIRSLGAAGRYDTLETLKTLAVEGLGPERAAAVSALGALGHPSARSALASALNDEEADVRAEAAEAVGAIVLDDLRFRLVELLSDAAWSVRFQAARALLRFGQPGKADLMRAALEPADPRAGRAASLVLAEGGGE